ncbi:MAG: hypothetical protein AAFN65_13525, partial [Bacteroidota bacterium]
MAPKLLGENGLYLQIGPANSDNAFNVEPDATQWTGLIGPTYPILSDVGNFFPLRSYYNHYQYGTYMGDSNIGTNTEFGIEEIGLYPTAPIPSNFGIGLPWHMMLKFYSQEIRDWQGSVNPNLLVELPYDGNSPNELLLTYRRSPLWWIRPTTPYNPVNTPTLANENVKLDRVRIYRYKRKPVVLKSVKHYAVNVVEGQQPDYGDFHGAGYEVSRIGFRYDTREQIRHAEVCGGGNTAPSNGGFDIIRLREIVQLPIGFSGFNSQYDNTSYSYPTSGFEYSDLGDYAVGLSEIGLIFSNGDPFTTSILNNYYYQVISKITSPIGGETTVHYSNFDDVAGSCNSYVQAIENSAFAPSYAECNQSPGGSPCGNGAPSGIVAPKTPPVVYSINLLVDHIEVKENGSTVYFDFKCFGESNRLNRYTTISTNL